MVFHASPDYFAALLLARMLLTTRKLTPFLEIAVAMKLTSLSKSVRSIGLMTLLSATIGTTLQQPVQAQEAPPNFSVLAKDKNGVCSPLPQGVFYQEFGGITFSPEQKAAYRKFDAEARKRYKPIIDNPKKVIDPDGPVGIEFRPGIGDKKAFEIVDALDVLIRRKLSTAQQVEALTKSYGQYAIFSPPEGISYSPKQISEGKRITRNWEAQTMAILTPKQQKIYKANLALQDRIMDCGIRDQPIDRLLSPAPY